MQIFMNLRITCVQNDVIAETPEANRRHIDEMLKNVENTDVIVLPETFTTGFPADPNVFAEEPDGVTMRWMCDKALEKNSAVCGTILTKIEGNFYNSFIWMQPDGKYHIYNKRHLFTMGGETGLKKGNECITIEYKGWRIRPFVCYDLRFPVWNRNSFKDGKFEYDVVVFTAEWPESKSYVWKTLLQARAIENQAYVVGVNRVGVDSSDIVYRGDSSVFSMKGRLMASAGDKEEVFAVELSRNDLEAYRNYFTVAKDWD